MSPSSALTGRRARAAAILLPLLLATGLATASPGLTAGGDPARICGAAKSGEQCGPGNGRRTAGGGEKVSHKGWPAVTGVLWKVLDAANHRKVGGADNDELLGHHGSDVVVGQSGNDILWGDWDPHANTTRQVDVLSGGAGNDWLYPSHGRNTVLGGPGRDYIWAFYGHGVIDCGPGRDMVRVRMNGAYRLRGCEIVNHFCAFGSNGRGGCLKPGERRPRARLRD